MKSNKMISRGNILTRKEVRFLDILQFFHLLIISKVYVIMYMQHARTCQFFIAFTQKCAMQLKNAMPSHSEYFYV